MFIKILLIHINFKSVEKQPIQRWMCLLFLIDLWTNTYLRMKQGSKLPYSYFPFLGVKPKKPIHNKYMNFYYSSVTQFFKFLPTYVSKSDPYLSLKGIFNDLSADRLVSPAQFTLKNWKPADIQQEWLPSVLLLRLIFHTIPCLPISRGCSISDKAYPSQILNGWKCHKVMNKIRMQQAWSPTIGICSGEQFVNSAHEMLRV